MIAEIIAIGSELLTPFRQDTNSLFLTRRLNEIGVSVAFKDIVGDDPAHLANVARTALTRSDILIFMGGLGPTEDDLTRQCVAEALGIELRRDPDILAELYARYAARRSTMPPNNAQQADVLYGAEVIRNPRGSAPAQWLEGLHNQQQRVIILLPGPPWELEPLFDDEMLPRLKRLVPEAHIASRVLKIAMLGESSVDAKAAPIYKQHTDVQTTILASAGEVQFHLKATAATAEVAEERVERLASHSPTPSKRQSSLPAAKHSKRLSAFISKCAGTPSLSRSPAPAASSPSVSRPSPAARVIFSVASSPIATTSKRFSATSRRS